MQIPVQIEQQGHAVLGMLHLPAHRAARAPLIVLGYGMNGDRVDNHRLSILLAERAGAAGISLLRFDYRGCGVSGGEFQDTSIATKVADTLAWLDFIRSCLGGPEVPIVMLGYSDGIRVVHQVLRARADVHAIVLWNPILRSMTPTFRAREGKRMTLEPTTKKLVFPLFGVYMGVDYLRQASEDLDVAEVLAHPLPKLFAFGTGDAHTLGVQRELRELRRARADFDLLEIEDANHLFNRLTWSERLVERTVRWVLQTST